MSQKKLITILTICFILTISFLILFSNTHKASASVPIITEYWNSQTKDETTNITMELKNLIVFRVTTGQDITTWNWYVDSENQNNNDNSFVWRAGPEDKNYTISANGTNTNGTTNTITWNIHIPVLGYGNISGIITDKDTSNPAQGATITDGTNTTTTNADGSYTLSNIKQDGYTFTVSKDIYNHYTKYIEVIADETTTQDFQLTPYVLATITYDGTKILISNGTATLTTINEALNDSDLLEQLSEKEWLLKVPIQVCISGSFYVNDSDCDWLKLLSLNDSNEAYIDDHGLCEIKNTKITSWNTTANDFAYMRTPGKTNDTTRAYIYSTRASSTMNIYDSNLSYLGDSGILRYGVTYWQTGNFFEVMNSTLINNYRGVYVTGSAGGTIKNNTITNSVDRCIDTHQKNNNQLIIDGNIIDNPAIHCIYEGITIEGNNSIIKNNYVANVGYNGIHLMNQWANNNVVENNSVYYAYHTGIDIHNYAFNNTVRNCTVWDCGHDTSYGGDGIFVHNYGVHDNTVIDCTSYNNRNNGFKLLGGYNNTITNCTAYGSPLGIAILAMENVTVDSSNFSGSQTDVSLRLSYWNGDVAPYPCNNITFTNCSFSTFAAEDTASTNYVINPTSDSFSISINDANNELYLEITDGRTFKLDGGASSHTSKTLTEPGTYTIEVEEPSDLTSPHTSSHTPSKNSTSISKQTNILLHIQDNDSGVDQSSIQMTVEGETVSPTITGTTSDYTLTYNPPADFDYNQVVNVTIGASDLASTPNAMNTETYSFTIESSQDQTPPTGSILINSGDSQTNSQTANLTISATDESDVTQMKISETNDFSLANTEPYSTIKSFILSIGDGIKTIYIWFKDTIGNWNTEPYSDSIELDSTGPTISSIQETNITTNSSTITFQTNEDSTSQIEYGLTSSYGSQTTKDSNLETSHSVNLTELSDNTTYHYKVISEDSFGNSANSIDKTFTTLEAPTPDTTSPQAITDLSSSNITQTSADLSWTSPGDDNNTGTASAYDIRYSTSNITESNWNSAIQISGEPIPQTAGTEQSVYIAVGLSPSTKYYFAIKASDEVPNTSNISNILSFTTLSSSGGGGGGGGGGTISDTTPPSKPSNFTATGADKQIVLTWNNPTDSDFVRVKLLRKETSSPASHNDSSAETIYEGTNQEYTDIELNNNTTYYYSIFAYDKKPNYSEILSISSKPIEGKTSISNGNGKQTYPEGTLIKIPESFKIYVIINQKKKWIPTPEVFETLGYKWTSITEINKTELNQIPNYEDNLIREINNYKVYLIVSGIKRHIPNPEIFLNYGFEWNDVKDVNQETINQYNTAKLIKESKQDKVYYLCQERKIRRWLRSPEIFNSYNNKWENIQVISKYEMEHYMESNLIKLIGDDKVYLVENNTKRWIKSSEEFERLGLDWGMVMEVGEVEINL